MGSLTRTTRKVIDLIFGPDKKTPKQVISFQRYLNRAYKAAKDAHELGPTDLGLRASIPISIYLRSKGPDHVYAGVFDEIAGVGHHLDLEEYFSGSLPKVAAMFAAFKLRREARLLIKDIKGHTETATAATFFTKLEPRLHLSDAVPLISSNALIRKKPSFDQILAVTGSFADPATLAVDFTADFRSHMRKMIIPSDNCSAGECIFRISYPYINVALMQDGYFNRDTMKGIWLCGDYILTSPPFPPSQACLNQAKKQPYIRIDTVNDCDQVTHFCGSAQNTTSKEMSRLFLDVLLADPDDPAHPDPPDHPNVSRREMRAMLREGQHGSPPGTAPPVWPIARDTSFLTRGPTILFEVDAVKIGQGPIKTDPDRDPEVRSEGLLIKWKKITPSEADFDPALKKKFDDLNLTGEAAICWQNLGNAADLDGIANVINHSVSDYINQVPLAP
jgi:hypothetical protein